MSATQFNLFSPAPHSPPATPESRAYPIAGAGEKPIGLRLRDYQVAARLGGDVDGVAYPGIVRALRDHRSSLLAAATGCGKTVIFCEEMRERGGGLVLAHRDILVGQSAQKLREATGEYVGVEKAERRAFGTRYLCASVQTLKGDRLKNFALRFPWIDFIVTDEGHRGVAKSYRAIYDAFPNAKLLFASATFDRGDGIGMHNVSDSVAYRYDILNATDDGWLVEIDGRPVQARNVNLDRVSTSHGDLNQTELDDEICKAARDIAWSVVEKCGIRRTLVFTPGVKTAEATAAAINALRPGGARAIFGEMDDDAKDAIWEGHRNGEFPALVNCNMATEGYDDPDLEIVFDASPTKSRLRHGQRLGRLTRPCRGVVDGVTTVDGRKRAIAASKKPIAYYLDLACNGERHTLASPVDLLGGRFTDDERALARKILAEKGGKISDVLTEARGRVEEERQKIAAAAVRAVRAKLDVIVGNPYDMFGIKRANEKGRHLRPEDRISPKQRNWLRWKGIAEPDNCSKGQAGRLITEERRRESEGLTLAVDIVSAARHGLDIRDWRRASWLTVHGELVRCNWRLPRERLAALLAREPGSDG